MTLINSDFLYRIQSVWSSELIFPVYATALSLLVFFVSAICNVWSRSKGSRRDGEESSGIGNVEGREDVHSTDSEPRSESRIRRAVFLLGMLRLVCSLLLVGLSAITLVHGKASAGSTVSPVLLKTYPQQGFRLKYPSLVVVFGKLVVPKSLQLALCVVFVRGSLYVNLYCALTIGCLSLIRSYSRSYLSRSRTVVDGRGM